MWNSTRTVALAGAIAMLVTGCALTQQARKTEPAGFLGDYSNLKEGGKDEALLVYIDESTPSVQLRQR